MSTVPYEQAKIIQTNNLIITREAGLTPRESSIIISYDVYEIQKLSIQGIFELLASSTLLGQNGGVLSSLFLR